MHSSVPSSSSRPTLPADQLPPELRSKKLPGQVLSHAAAWPSKAQLPNEQLRARLPQLMQSLVPNQPGEHPLSASVTVHQIGQGKFGIKLHLPPSTGSEARAALSKALVHLLGGTYCGIHTAVPNEADKTTYFTLVELSTKRQSAELVYKQFDEILSNINKMAALVGELGGDTNTLATLLGGDLVNGLMRVLVGEGRRFWFCEVGDGSLRDIGRLGRGTSEVARPALIGGACPLVIVGCYESMLEVEDVAHEFASAGLHAVAIELWLSSLGCVRRPVEREEGSSEDEFECARLAFNELGNCLRDGGFSIETIADIVHPLLLVASELQFLQRPRDALGCLDAVMDRLCSEGDPQRLLQLVEAMLPLIDDALTADRAIRLLESACLAAIERTDTKTSQGAITLLNSLSCNEIAHGNANEALKRLQEHRAWDVVAFNPFRETLKGKEFEFEIQGMPSAGLRLQVTKGAFVPADHAENLIKHANLVLDIATHPEFAANFGAPVVEFLLSCFTELNDQQKRDVCKMCDRMGDLQDRILQSAVSGNDPARAAAVLQQLISFSLLTATLDVLKKGGGTLESINAACWLLQNRQQFFGDPSADTLQQMLVEAVLSQKLDVAELQVNEEMARDFLQDAIAPAVKQFNTFFQNNVVPLQIDTEHPLLEYWMALVVTDTTSRLTAKVEGIANATIDSRAELERAKSLCADARQRLAAEVNDPKADTTGLLRLHKALIDSAVGMCQQNMKSKSKLANEIIEWAGVQLAHMGADDAVVKALVERGHPEAAAWPALGSVQLKIQESWLTKEEVAELDTQLEKCAALPGIKLDRTFHDVLVNTIQLHIDRKEFTEALSLLRLLYTLPISPETPVSKLRPIEAGQLGLLADWFNSKKPAVNPKETMVALVRALMAHSPEFADLQIERVRVQAGGLLLEAPQLVCLGYLQMAQVCAADGKTHKADLFLVKALTYLPRNEFERDGMLPAFRAFWEQAGTKDEEIKEFTSRFFDRV